MRIGFGPRHVYITNNASLVEIDDDLVALIRGDERLLPIRLLRQHRVSDHVVTDAMNGGQPLLAAHGVDGLLHTSLRVDAIATGMSQSFNCIAILRNACAKCRRSQKQREKRWHDGVVSKTVRATFHFGFPGRAPSLRCRGNAAKTTLVVRYAHLQEVTFQGCLLAGWMRSNG